MKKLRMIVTSVVVLAIVGSAFAFNAKKLLRFCYSSVFSGSCVVSPAEPTLERVAEGTAGSVKRYYVVNWNGNPATCTSTAACEEPAGFIID